MNIQLNNTEIKCLKTSELLNLNIVKPDIQRIVDLDKVAEIINFQLEFKRNNGFFNFSASGPINIHIWNEQSLLIDGQHRFAALDKLYNKYCHDIESYVNFVTVNTQEELEFNYKMINMNTPLPDFSEFPLIDKKIPETVAADFKLKYPEIWSKTSRSRRPHIFWNHFQETLAYICSEIPDIKTGQKLTKIVQDYNDKLQRWPRENFKGVNDKMYKKAKKCGLFLGLDKYKNSEEYRYDWARKIVEEQTGRTIRKKTITNKKKNIPKKLKADLWNKYVGREKGESNCIVCRNTKISMLDFNAAHIKSEANGGTVDLDNLLPTCAQCNSSMGKRNMPEYINQYYPKNYKKFVSRDYKIKKTKITIRRLFTPLNKL